MLSNFKDVSTINQLFESQVESTPAAVAVVFEGEQLNYQSLNRRSNQLAHYLRTLGVGPEVLVGICVERSLEMIVGILGILKAGGAYVPLDPAYPQERLAFMLEDAQVSVLLAQQRTLNSLPVHQARTICLDADWEVLVRQSEDNLVNEVTLDNSAYVIYTSGSTSRPKGVLVTHRGLCNLVKAQQRLFNIQSDSRVLQFASLSFDASIWEVSMALMSGATLCLGTRESLLPGAPLIHLLREQKITTITLPPSVLAVLPAEELPALQTIIVAGETCSPGLVARWASAYQFFNAYGPTEVTVCATVAECTSDSQKPPIGRPIANTQSYLLDAQLQPVSVGVPGELYIGGAGLARGYLNQPDLTAEQFIPNPFSDEPGGRLYKTGDLGRYLPDGNIEFLGRIDQQVKIRGFRIELGEIEAVLSQHPDVLEAVVIVREDVPEDKRLVAYIVSNLIPDRVPMQIECLAELDGNQTILTTQDISCGGVGLVGVPATWKQGQRIRLRLLLPSTSEAMWLEGSIAWCEGKQAGVQFDINPTEQSLLHQSVEYLLETQDFMKVLQRTVNRNLRSFLKQNLPDYMVPSRFVVLNALPLTPNGKVDRRALPAPDRTRSEQEDKFVAPRTFVEEMLAGIWAEVLGLDRVGIHDNFLELGGHSLLATQIVSRVRVTYQVELPLRQMFETPTVAGLVESIETARLEEQGLPALPIQPASRHQDLPLSFAQERLWFLDQLIPAHPFYNVPQAVRLTGSLNAIALEQSLNELIRRHEVLRTTFATVNGQPIQVIHPVPAFTLPVMNLQNLPKVERQERTAQLISQDAQLPFDLAQGPLLRATLLRLSKAEHILLLTLHHILCDDWSLGILFKELAALYEAFLTGKPTPLPELAIQYADFAVWQRQWLQGEVRSSQTAYWQQQLTDLPSLQLPTDRPRPAVLTYRGARQSLVLTKTLTDALKDLSRQEKSTLFMTLLAAFQTLLSRYTGHSDIVVGSPIANRHRRDVEGLLGFFVNTLVLRTDLSGNPSFRELLARVREVALGAYAYQDLPFEQLVEELQPERDLSLQPLFQVVFALQDVPVPDLEISELTLKHQEVYNETTKFDLHLGLSETPEGLTGWLEYSTDLFDASTIARMAKQFQTLLEGIVANPGQCLSDLPLLTPAERHQLLVVWNDTQADYPKDACIHQLFEAQVERIPAAVAVVFENQQLTYRELNNRANQLAHHLRSLGVGPEVLVGISVERSLEMIVGILGILKAGGAYVPLDPKWPTERIQRILSSLELHCLVTQYSQLRDIHDLQWKLPRLIDVICLDVKMPKLPPEPLDIEVVCSLWDHLAESAVDRVTAGGFISSYTGKPFSEAEVDEYRDHVVKLAEPYLGPRKRVLEIGCGSELIGFAISPKVNFYLGLDPSEVTQARNRMYATEKGYSNIQLQTGFAHEITSLDASSFDLIVLASTVQFFPGPIYLKQVIEQALQLLAPGGVILIADILDSRRKDDFKKSLEEFRNQHCNESNFKTKTRLGSELYLDADFFCDLRQELRQIADVTIIHREQGFANELRYRYDVILQKTASDSISASLTSPVERKKRLSTSWDLNQLPESNLSTSVTSDNVAYVIHTSGSTGVPKGVVVRHRPTVNLIDWVNKTFEIGASDRILFTTSLCFDLSVYDIFGILAAGGSIHVATESDLQEPRCLVNLLCHEQITFWDSAPAALQQLVPFFPTGEFRNGSQLRLVFLSGDWIPVTLPDLVKNTFPGVEVISLGGATEATIWSNYYSISKVEPRWVSIPYGKPIQNAEYCILDSYLNPCPIGVAGGLYIGGVCLAAGYTDPGQTAEKFIPNPFSDKPGDRLYKTGDQARYLPDGNIEFLGRIDQQVKIRGFRIELGEVEAVLGKHPSVQVAVVITREDVPNDKRLVAYVVPKQESTPSISELRCFLKENLPNYMVPSAFVILEDLPLTPNGKVDRRVLPPDSARSELKEVFVAPQTPVEEQLASIWTRVLRVEKVGIVDNFFEIGGNSLLATQLIAYARETFQVELPVRCLFEKPTVEGLAQTLEIVFREGLTALTTVIDLKAEAVLDADILPSGTPIDPIDCVSEPRHIFLTGATGFLGAFLLHELLQQTQAKLHCLVRASNTQEGLKRLQRTLEKYFLWDSSLSSRIIPILGDISQPLLGVSIEQFERLAEQIDTIYHSGAQVNFVKPYSLLKAANVLGTQEVIRLACQGKVKPLHYMSTAAVFGTIGHFTGLEVLREETDISCSEDYVYMGYTRSKWVAEKLVWIAKSRGLPVSIFRLGFLIGDTQKGVTNTDDFLSRFIKSCIQIGSFPSLDSTEYFIPIDYASRAIVHLTRKKESLGQAFHIVNPQHIHFVDFFELLNLYGCQLKKLPYTQWKDELIQHTKQSQENALYPLLPLLTEKVFSEQLTVLELYERNPYYDCQKTLDGLADTSIVCPPLDTKLLDTCFSYFIRSGFLNLP